jgi:hypothetical protein
MRKELRMKIELTTQAMLALTAFCWALATVPRWLSGVLAAAVCLLLLVGF